MGKRVSKNLSAPTSGLTQAVEETIRIVPERLLHNQNASNIDNVIHAFRSEFFDSIEIIDPDTLPGNLDVTPITNTIDFPWYESDQARMELAAMSKALFRSKGIIHYLNAHSHYHFTRQVVKMTDSIFTATIHQPPSVIELMHAKENPFPGLKGSVAVSRGLADYLRDRVDGPTAHIPLGIDTDIFSPEENIGQHPQSPFHVLFVGQWLRDFRCIHQILKRLKNDREIIVTMVIPVWQRRCFDRTDNVRVLSKISQEFLIELYRQSGCVIFPLLDSTANAAMMEAGACGCTIIATDVGGVRDMLDDTTAILLDQNDPDQFVDAVYRCKSDADLQNSMGTKLRKRICESFTWQKIADRYVEFFQQVIAYWR